MSLEWLADTGSSEIKFVHKKSIINRAGGRNVDFTYHHMMWWYVKICDPHHISLWSGELHLIKHFELFLQIVLWKILQTLQNISSWGFSLKRAEIQYWLSCPGNPIVGQMGCVTRWYKLSIDSHSKCKIQNSITFNVWIVIQSNTMVQYLDF